MASKPFRFGIQLHDAPDRQAWIDQVRQVEDLGFSTVFLPDHFGDQLAPVPALMAAADATTDLRIGALVFDNDYKHPVVLAKEAATLDVLSGGRLELGIGAGWMISDYEQAGMPYDAAGVRVSRMEEGIKVLKGLLQADGPFSFEGEHYTITGLQGYPKPVQQPHPPFLIGGGGKRVLTIAGREAQIVGLNPNAKAGKVDNTAGASATKAATLQKLEWVKAGAGARFDDIELNVLVFFAMITDDRSGVADMLASGFGFAAEEAMESPHAVFGSVDSIVEDLQRRREELGISYVVFQGAALEAMAPVVEKLAGS